MTDDRPCRVEVVDDDIRFTNDAELARITVTRVETVCAANWPGRPGEYVHLNIDATHIGVRGVRRAATDYRRAADPGLTRCNEVVRRRC